MWRAVAFAAVLVLMPAAVACAAADEAPSSAGARTSAPRAGTGPAFERCGGLTLADVAEATGFGGLALFVDNTSSCEWRVGARPDGPVVSVNWNRGSPIGRERGQEQLLRDDEPVDIEIDGHPGFLARNDPLCDVGVQFGDDFLGVSVYDRGRDGRRPPVPVDPLCAAAKDLAARVVERAS